MGKGMVTRMAKDGKYDRTVYQSLALVTQFGITMLVPIFLCSFMGWFLDERLGTSFLFVVLFFIGALAGFRNIFVLSKKISESKDKDGYEAVRRSIREEVAKTAGSNGDEKDERQ